MDTTPTKNLKEDESNLSFVTIHDDNVLKCLEKNKELRVFIEEYIEKIRPRISQLLQEGFIREASLVKTNIHCCIMLLLKRNVEYEVFLDEFKYLEDIYFEHIKVCSSDTLSDIDIIEYFVIDQEV